MIGSGPADIDSTVRGFAAMVDAAPVAILLIAELGDIVLVNELAGRMFGYAREELVGRSVEVLLPARFKGRHVTQRAAYQGDARARRMGQGRELYALHRDGHEIPVEVGLKPVIIDGARHVVCTVADISERARVHESLAESETNYKVLFESMRDGVGVIQDRRFVLFNSTLLAMVGYTAAEFRETEFEDFMMPEFVDLVRERYAERVGSGEEPPGVSELRFRRADGNPGPWVEINARRIQYHGRPASLVVVRDITARKQDAVQLEHRASSDSLTGLANRDRFADRVEQALRAARRHHQRAAILYLDLDGFKPVNDRHGHAAGDHVLREVAARLVACVRGMDTVSRLGGDEFGILLTELDAGHSAARVAAKVLEETTRPIEMGPLKLRVGVSIGIAVHPEHGEDSATLLLHADEALYDAKARGKNRYCVYGD